MLERVFEEMRHQHLVSTDLTALCLDSTSVKVHPDAAGARKKGPQAIGRSRGRLNTTFHLVAADDRTALTFSLSPGQAHDDPEGRKLWAEWETSRPDAGLPMLMDRAYEGEAMRQAVWKSGLEPVVPLKKNHVKPWEYDKELYKRRNEIERLFRRLKVYRRIFTRYDKLDRIFKTFIYLALPIEILNCVNTT